MISFEDLADNARDAKDWVLARHLYAQQLGIAPDRADLWVQYGHALKESGIPRLAECAYRQAIALRPVDSDSYLQLGHVLKISGAVSAAAVAYTAATRFDQKSDAARDLAEIIRKHEKIAKARREWLMRHRDSDVWPSRTRTLCVDVSDLYRYEKKRPTGIQRVQMGVAMALMHDLMTELPLVFLRYDERRETWVQVSGLELSELSNSLKNCDGDRMAALSPVSVDEAPAFRFPEGACYLLLGTAWDNSSFALQMEKLKHEHRAKIVCMVHDAIPVVAPHFCAHGVPEQFGKWLDEILGVADGLLVSSSSTKFEIERYCAQRNLKHPPIHNVKLNVGLDRTADSQAVAAQQELVNALGFDPTGEEFVLCVGTIEPRKNHTTLFSTWLSLERAGQGMSVPRLICVGGLGWAPATLQSQLEAKIRSSGRIFVVSGLSDDALALLFWTCLFSVYPTLHEGWGLPVSESLAAGKLVLTGAHTSLVEAGGDFAHYVDVADADQIASKVRELLANRELIAGAEQRIRDGYKACTWTTVAEGILKETSSIASSVND